MKKKAVTFVCNSIHSIFSFNLYIIILLFNIFALTGCSSPNNEIVVSEETNQVVEVGEFDGVNNTSMFDGENLGLWEQSFFFEGIYEQGNVYVEDGAIILEKCDWMTGIKWTGPYQMTNYGIYFEAKRLDGEDFFSTLTFPVGEDSCSLVLGGWSNTISGISNINNRSANENVSTVQCSLRDDTWYRVYVEITPRRIKAWVDEIPLVDVDISDKIINVRTECEPSLPLGFATYMSTGAIRNIHYYAF